MKLLTKPEYAFYHAYISNCTSVFKEVYFEAQFEDSFEK